VQPPEEAPPEQQQDPLQTGGPGQQQDPFLTGGPDLPDALMESMPQALRAQLAELLVLACGTPLP
jgi:hypothetical protein